MLCQFSWKQFRSNEHAQNNNLKTSLKKQLENAISKRQIDFEELNVDVQDAAMVKTIEDTLSSDNEMKQPE